MQIKSILTGAAVALAATVGSASAGDEFATLRGVAADPLMAAEMAQVRGMGNLEFVIDGLIITGIVPTAVQVFEGGNNADVTTSDTCVGHVLTVEVTGLPV